MCPEICQLDKLCYFTFLCNSNKGLCKWDGIAWDDLDLNSLRIMVKDKFLACDGIETVNSKQ